MKEYTSDEIRNIALVGHGGSGKTSLSEVLLFNAKETNRIGKIEEGNTVSDYSPNEIDKQISISSSLMHLEWKNVKANIIDTPGFSDFVGDVKSALKVCDTAVLLVKSAEGIEVGTEVANEFIKEYSLPSAIIINKVDNEHSSFNETIEKAKERINSGVTVITFPVSEGINYNTVVDVIKMKAYNYGEPGSRKVTEADIPDELKTTAEDLRTQLVEKVAENSEELMNKYFEEGNLSDEDLQNGLKSAIINGSFVPAFAISATKAIGVDNFLDFAVNYFPSPLERGTAKAKLAEKNEDVEVKIDANGEPVMFIFKTISEQHVGELSLFKVYSGKISTGMDLINEANNKTERLNQISILNGHNRKEVSQIVAGDIGAVVKLKDTHTNNTLASKNYSVIINPIEFPEPVIRAAIVAKAKGDEDKIGTGLHTLHEEDPSFKVNYDAEISQTIIAGQGEMQLSLAVKRLKDRYGVGVDLVEPRVPFRETIKASINDVEYKHKKQSGGRGQYGHVHFKVEPLPRGKGFEFVNAIVGGVVPGRFIPAVEKGINETMAKGVIAGNNVVDVKVTLFDGTYHNVDSDEMSFKIASSMCFRKGFQEAKPVLLEPIYEVEVKVPEDYMGDVMGDISSKRGKILGMDSDGHFQIIKAHVPLAELYKYSSHLRSLTQGRGTHKRNFDHYEEMPKEIEQKVIEEYKKSKEEGN
ncbi:MAG: elongation factor G [Ignavibacteria bacterium]|nr:elongation factor G [Ignavibacteria bacterium]MBT8381422.1 elongation factor G [Ignavibacteria bacterium]MBT8392926.1 elongation factor G [Ignavibacteria bacterium]NNJ53743.1 elongation factor G [Ignavibacteriaceae bacterium]NNL20598.1 elongation factor G [Ignavibacteriaceae bacterium]